ncbi:unnamed protein product [Heligmosomoides polygyrus]|uniref:Transposase n=1 Tax=Heligmosomoides polygyrus TaxID=6339 RepID=A0A183FDE2_HELPZ|nr:unnamed protein product [Heligmosomoides polygyrus]
MNQRDIRVPLLLNDQLEAMVEADPRPTVREPAQHFDVDGSTISRHLNGIGRVEKLDEWIPHKVPDGQMLKRDDTCASLRLGNLGKPCSGRIITCDEERILFDNHGRSAQWLDRNESPKEMMSIPRRP